MLCYTLRGTSLINGIQPIESNGDLFIKVGEQISLDREFTPKEVRPIGIPLGKTKRDQLQQLTSELELPSLPFVTNASLSTDGMRLVDEQWYCPKCWGVLNTIHLKESETYFCSGCKKQSKLRFNDRVALVLSAPIAEKDSRAFYTDRTWTADFSRNRLRRSYNTFPSPGVEVLLTGHGPNEEPWGLFMMSPSSGFRISYTGRKELAGETNVNWNGQELFVRHRTAYTTRDLKPYPRKPEARLFV